MARPILGTLQGATSPFFSPDSQWIGFYADGSLRKIAVTGGAPVTLCAAGNPHGASWSGDVIVFGQGAGNERNAGIFAVPAAGGEPELIVKPEAGETVSSPQLLPGGET